MTNYYYKSIYKLNHTREYNDIETTLHPERVAHYSKILAAGLGLDQRFQRTIFNASFYHDVGKIGIPDEILRKGENLNKEEYEIMKMHTTIGHEISKFSKGKYLKVGGLIALTHHEKYDGSGYPHGLSGDSIPIEGRIVAVADVFDTLTSEDLDQESWSFEKAVDFLKQESGKHFDPKLVKIFTDNIKTIRDIYHKYR